MRQDITTIIDTEYKTFRYNPQCNFIENMKFKDTTNIAELKSVKLLLETNDINYKVFPTFDIRIL